MMPFGRASRLAALALASPRDFLIARRSIAAYGAVQRTSELARVLGDVRRLRPMTIVEIGSYRGGTLYAWGRVSPAGALLVSVDLDASRAASVPHLRRRRVVSVVGDSHLPATVERVRTALGGRPVDFLFIDGDHSYEGVSGDFFGFAGLVRRGGLIALHDIVRDNGRPDLGVWRLWQELRQMEHAREVVDPHGREFGGMGIGLITMMEQMTAWAASAR